MLNLFAAMYLWAGFTVLKSMLLFAEIGEQLGRKSVLKDRLGVQLTVVLGWPVALPVWLVVGFLEKQKESH